MTDIVVTLPEQSWVEGLHQRRARWDGVRLALWDLTAPPDLPDPEAVEMVVLPYTDPPRRWNPLPPWPICVTCRPSPPVTTA